MNKTPHRAMPTLLHAALLSTLAISVPGLSQAAILAAQASAGQAIAAEAPAVAYPGYRAILETQADEKLAYGWLLLGSGAVARAASDGAAGAERKGQAQALLEKAGQAREAGDLELCLQEAEQAIVLLEGFGVSGTLQGQHRRYSGLLDSLKYFESAHDRNYRREVAEHGVSAGVAYDEMEVERLVRGAGELAEAQQYNEAIALLGQAKNHIAKAIRAMLNDKSLRVERYSDAERDSRLGSAEAQADRYQSIYQHRLDGLQLFKAAHERNYARVVAEQGEAAGVSYDRAGVEKLIAHARTLADEGAYQAAVSALDQAKGLIAQAIKRMLNTKSFVVQRDDDGYVPSIAADEQAIAEVARKAYEKRLEGVTLFKAAHGRNHGHLAAGEKGLAAFQYNQQSVDELVAKAEQLAYEQHYREATELLVLAQQEIAVGIRGMLDSKDFVVKLDLSTPEAEFAYEQRRYRGYDELVPVAVDRLQPSATALAQIDKLVEKGRWMAEQAKRMSERGDYPVAIRMQMDATDQIQQALKLAGVPVWTMVPSRAMME